VQDIFKTNLLYFYQQPSLSIKFWVNFNNALTTNCWIRVLLSYM